MQKVNWSQTIRNVIILAIIPFFCVRKASAQFVYNTAPNYYSVPMKRILAIFVGNYINQVTQNQMNLDSANSMACHMYRLNWLLPYNERFDGNHITRGMLLINSGKIFKAKEELKTLKNDEEIIRLFELGTYYLFRPVKNKSDLDSVKFYADVASDRIKQSGSEKWKDASDELYGKYYSRANYQQKSQAYFQDLVERATSKKDEPGLAGALYIQAKFLPLNSPHKIALLQRSLSICRELKLTKLEFQVTCEIFTIHFMLSNGLVDKEIVQILKLEDMIGFRHQQYTYNVYAYMAFAKADFLSGLEYAKRSLNYMKMTGDSALSSLCYERMGDAMKFLSESDQAIAWYQRAIDGTRTKQNQQFWYKSFLSEVGLLKDRHHFVEALNLVMKIKRKYPPTNTFDQINLYYCTARCYYGLKRYAESEAELRKFMPIAEHYPITYIHYLLPDGYFQMAETCSKEHKFGEARAYIRKAEALNRMFKSVITKMNLYETRFSVDSAMGNNTAAIKDYQAYKMMFDSINNTQVRQKYNQLKVKYETVDKDRNIKFLKKANELQKTKLKQDSYYSKMTIGGAAFVSIIAILLYYLYRSKQQSNIMLQGQQKVLKSLLTEKEWLVKEIHHRVKNNLHTIVSLLESQSAYLHNDDALAAVKDSQHRVHAMSLIHQKLYMGTNMTSIKSADYIKELVNYLKESFNLDNSIKFEMEIKQVDLDVAQAIPLGLIINEGITNAIKYAFNQNGGTISISLEIATDQYLLKIEDNGRGLPLNFDVNDRTKSLGMSLITGLTKEIGGIFKVYGKNGTSLYISFPPYEIMNLSSRD